MTDEQTPDTDLDDATDGQGAETSPGSERETAAAQDDPTVAPDIDQSRVKSPPGAGGPDDAGDIDIEGAPIHLPGREPAD